MTFLQYQVSATLSQERGHTSTESVSTYEYLPVLGTEPCAGAA